MNRDERVSAAVAVAQEAFWAVIAEHFPECTSGDLDPCTVMMLDDAQLSAVRTWVWANAPEEDEMDDFKGWAPEYQAALKAYAEAKGKDWEQRLCEDWAIGRDVHFPEHGAALRGIRNHPGCAPVIYERAWGPEESR